MLDNPLFKDLSKLVIGDTSKDLTMSFMAGLHKDLLSSIKNFPPCNIVKHDAPRSYMVQIAVAGYDRQDLSVDVVRNELVVTGKHSEDTEKLNYLYNGIANRSFRRTFVLLDDLKVSGVILVSGMLEIQLKGEAPAEEPKQSFDIN
ncbi:Hsp20 family protein [Comamonas thiooxydans]|uniref:Hsp20 family protein n=1 Tax=Comamonas thiooxydans TaxID=363952 RepID=UPI000B4127F0|nr:Hsp20 family protein [Comamonas thiooxydans]